MLTPRTAASVYRFRTAHARTAPPGTPKEVLPAVIGTLAELHIEHLFPRTTCHIQVDLIALAIRWTNERSISLRCVEDVGLGEKPKRRITRRRISLNRATRESKPPASEASSRPPATSVSSSGGARTS
eukprot:5970941-Prymnesium_polylepis.1